MKNFKDLLVWQESIKLALVVYEYTNRFPAEERYGLAGQTRRAAISIPSNIAEGHMRSTNADFKQFLTIARGSCSELETQVLIAWRLKYLAEKDYKTIANQIEIVSKMLSSLRLKVSADAKELKS